MGMATVSLLMVARPKVATTGPAAGPPVREGCGCGCGWTDRITFLPLG